MNKKGFTLIEVLGVIILLAIVTTITVPAITRQIKKGNEESYNAQIKRIKTAADLYVSDNLNYFTSECTDIFLSTLQNNNYVDKDITNPLTNELFDKNMNIKVERGKDSNGGLTKSFTVTVNAACEFEES